MEESIYQCQCRKQESLAFSNLRNTVLLLVIFQQISQRPCGAVVTTRSGLSQSIRNASAPVVFQQKVLLLFYKDIAYAVIKTMSTYCCDTLLSLEAMARLKQISRRKLRRKRQCISN